MKKTHVAFASYGGAASWRGLSDACGGLVGTRASTSSSSLTRYAGTLLLFEEIDDVVSTDSAVGSDPTPRSRVVLTRLGTMSATRTLTSSSPATMAGIVVEEPIDVSAREDRSVRRHAKDWSAVLELNIRVNQSLEDAFDELLDRLTRLGRKTTDLLCQAIVKGDSGRHLTLIRAYCHWHRSAGRIVQEGCFSAPAPNC